MSPRERLYQLIDQMTDDQIEVLERITVAMLQPKVGRREPKSFEQAKEDVFTKFDVAFRNLAK